MQDVPTEGRHLQARHGANLVPTWIRSYSLGSVTVLCSISHEAEVWARHHFFIKYPVVNMSRSTLLPTLALEAYLTQTEDPGNFLL